MSVVRVRFRLKLSVFSAVYATDFSWCQLFLYTRIPTGIYINDIPTHVLEYGTKKQIQNYYLRLWLPFETFERQQMDNDRSLFRVFQVNSDSVNSRDKQKVFSNKLSEKTTNRTLKPHRKEKTFSIQLVATIVFCIFENQFHFCFIRISNII